MSAKRMIPLFHDSLDIRPEGSKMAKSFQMSLHTERNQS
jgi:hypothetical protein